MTATEAERATPYQAARRHPVNWSAGPITTGPAESAAPALIDAILIDAAETNEPSYRYGAGILAVPNDNLTHRGQSLGFETSFWVRADRHTSAAISCNLKDFSPDSLRSTIASVWTG